MTYRKALVRTRDDLPLGHWLARQLPPGTSLRTYAEERAIITLTRQVQDAIEDAGLSRAELAVLLGTSRSFVSQVLNGSANMTLKTLGALLWATGRQVDGLESNQIGYKRVPQGQVLHLTIPTSSTAPARPVEARVRTSA